MTDKIVNTSIEILGKLYPVRCQECEVNSLQMAAKLLNQKMREVQDSGKAINLERIAIITALNMANQLLQTDNQKSSVMQKINQRLTNLQNKLDNALNETGQSEMIYSLE
ncbi:MAG TPA: cell division protein ZapA [Gammaproteobacteria bacterium]|jgi:cell division protein ZapA|nr:cell division protein ZapA [Gammaproteobacteria bacterium]